MKTLRCAMLLLVFAAGAGAADRGLAPLPFDHILTSDELTRLLREWQTSRPDLMDLESIGTTPGKRPIWFVTITNRNSGPAESKPALLVDGNMHATEWAGGVAALHFIAKLLREYGTDERVTRLLNTRTVYVLPRMTPDGVDATLAQGRFIRSVDRPYPGDRPERGIHAQDVDGDGRTLFMRLRDPNGPWKEYPGDRRLLVPREPDEAGGEAWRVLPEGIVEGYDGATIADAPAREPIDLGANFPGDRGSAPPSPAAGPYPASEPEVAAYVAAIARRPNIVAHVTCHTFGGLILTPPVNLAERLPAADRSVYETLAAKGAALTGYRAMSYLDLRAQDRETYIPSAFGWLYDRRGIYSFITELWNPLEAAGISLEGTTVSAWLWGHHPIEDEIKLLRFSDAELGGEGFVRWRPFHHPQLGEVQIGGFDLIRYWYNVPFKRLEKEVAPHSDWLVYLGLATPRIAVREFSAEPAAGNVHRLRLVVENRGWLPTNGSQQAVDQNAVGGVAAELMLPPGARLVQGEKRTVLGQLQGRTAQRSTATWWSYAPGTPDRALAEWIVAAPAGTKIAVHVTHERAGIADAEVVLGKGERR
ncbi:MAG TPA: M14 family metallopeptidase [Thermoanaerobaculia bacterium]|nr:M14 family metallopeptidase [Thermoanaerobaculia bacterium]